MVQNWLSKQFQVSIIGHRGYNTLYPENTLLAFEKAIESNADYSELDVQITKDNHLIVIHDQTTGRVANKNLSVKDETLEELQQLDLGQNQHIPTLEEVFQLCKGKMGINIELKAKNLAEPVNDLVKKYEMENEIIVSSFNHEEILKMHRINPDIKIATLEPTGAGIFKYIKGFFSKRDFIEHAYTANADAIHPFVKLTNKKLCDKAHAADMLVNVWTSDKEKDWKRLISAGVDGIITNDPGALFLFLSNNI